MKETIKTVAYDVLSDMSRTAAIATVAYVTVYGLAKFIGPIQVKM